jgi:hypothetical protein
MTRANAHPPAFRWRAVTGCFVFLLSALTALAHAQAPVDGYVAEQRLLRASRGAPAAAVARGAGILGGTRGVEVRVLAGNGGAQAEARAGRFIFRADPSTTGEALLTWGRDPRIAAAGAAAETFDLAAGGATGVSLALLEATAGTELVLEAATDATHVSTYRLVVPRLVRPRQLAIPYAAFAAGPGGPALFARVQSLRLRVRGAGARVVLGTLAVAPTRPIGPLAPPNVTATKTAQLFVDLGSDTFADPGDTLKYTISVDTNATNTTGMQLTDTLDAQTSLVAGSVNVSPLALDDAYNALENTPLSVVAGAGLFANDREFLGDTFSLTSFEAASANGGSETVNADGSFTYTPPTNFTGTDTFHYTIGDSAGLSGSGTVTLTVQRPPQITSANTTTFTVGTPGTFDVTTTGVPLVTTIGETGALPSGVTFTNNGNGTATLAGTPGAGTNGPSPYALTITASNGVAPDASQNFTLNVVCPAITVTAPSLPTGTYNTAYTGSFAATGGTTGTTYTFTVDSGALPAGLSLNASSGALTSTPTVTGSFTFTIKATDGNGCFGTQGFTLAVQPKIQNDAYTGVGNTQMHVAGIAGAPSTPSVVVGSLLGNDSADVAIATAVFVGPSHGTVTVDGSGRFLYTPTVGYTGPDSFTYTGTTNGQTASATVSITLSGLVWYVDNSYGGGSGASNGLSHRPFTSFTGVAAGTNNGDFIYVAKGSGTTTGALTLKPSQSLIGAGATLNVPTVSPVLTLSGAAANTPILGGTLTLASNVIASGFDMSTGSTRGLTNFNGATYSSVTGVSVNARDLTTTTGTAIDIGGSGNTGSMTFRSVSTNGSSNGISLVNFTGGTFTITGDGASDPANTTRGNTTAKAGGGTITIGSGGTIQNTSGAGVVLSNTGAVSVTSLRVLNAGGASVNSGGNGITATTVGGLSLDNVLVTGSTGNSGLRGTGVTNLALQHVDIHGNGTAVGTETNDNWNVRLDDLAGNCGSVANGCGWNNSLFFSARENVVGLRQGVTNTTVNTTLTITNCEFRDTTLLASPSNNAFGISAFANAVTNVTATGSRFQNVEVAGFQYAGNDNSSGTVNVRNSIFETTGSDVLIAHNGGTPTVARTLNFDVSGNTTRQLSGNPGSTTAINVFLAGNSNAGSQMIGTIKNNLVGNAGVVGSGSHVGQGISLNATGAGTITATVTGNTVRQIRQDSVFFAEANSGSAKLNVFVHNNTFSSDQTGTGLDALDLTGGAVGSDAATLCVDMGGNTLVGDTTYTSVTVQTFGGFTSQVKLLGLGAANNNNTTAIANFVGASGATSPPGVNTSATPTPDSSFMIIAGGGQIVSTATCGVFP